MTLWDDDAFIGGHGILDFVNTVDDQDKQRENSRIADWPRFIHWANAASLFNQTQLQALEHDISTVEGSNLLVTIHRLRESMYQALRSIAVGDETPNALPQPLESTIKTAISRATLRLNTAQYQWESTTDHPEWVTDTLALALDNLLRTEDISKLKECGRCTWLFLNKGRGRGRRWCNMNTCGNRAKSASFRHRQQ